MSCESCKWWLKQDKDALGKAKDLYDHATSATPPFEAGFCVRFPPAPSRAKRAGWVTTRADDFCGEYQEEPKAGKTQKEVK